MINAHAVLEHFDELRLLGTQANAASSSPVQQAQSWYRGQLGDLPVSQSDDDAGNHWVTLPGASDRSLVLGSHLDTASGDRWLDGCLGMLVGVEVLKALARRNNGRPPCTIKLVDWKTKPSGADATPATQQTPPSNAPATVAAYLELHMEQGSQLEHASKALGVVAGTDGPNPVAFHPQLTTFCEEAIRELTGTSERLSSASLPDANRIARLGVPTAVMFVQPLHAGAPGQEIDAAARLHLQQAAESFGRAAESAMHWVAGETNDLWALEHRTPHLSEA